MYFVSSDAIYAIGPKKAAAVRGFAIDEPVEKGEGTATFLQVEPTELILKPGQTAKLHARLFDDKGRFLREDPAQRGRSLDSRGAVTAGSFTVSSDPTQAGLITAMSGTLKGESRARVIHSAALDRKFRRVAGWRRARWMGEWNCG